MFHLRGCLQVLWSTNAYVTKIKPFVTPEGATQSVINDLKWHWSQILQEKSAGVELQTSETSPLCLFFISAWS